MAEDDFEGRVFPYRRSVDQDCAAPARHTVVVVGAGPVGLTLAIDLAEQGIECVLLDDQLTLSNGSRAICFAKRTLEIFDRLGAGEEITEAGVDWHVGRVFFGEELLYQFDLASQGGQHRPAFINLQQFMVEGFLHRRAMACPGLDIRFGHKLGAIEQMPEGVRVTIQTGEGPYRIEADYLLACDGARSTARTLMGLATEGQVFKDRFLIADVRMRAPFPAERWFWFDPPFHRNQSALLHRQPGDIWRIDFQLGWDADPELEKQPERVRPRVAAMLGEDVEFDLVWVSVYTFACQRIEQFVHDRVIFVGDAAHGVSPFGARGANGGVQDADNLAWKLAAVLHGEAPQRLLDSYHDERSFATDENILNSTRSTDFITPKSPVSRMFRDAVLTLAKHYPFARSLVNSGRLSVPAVLHASALNSEDPDWPGGVSAGAPCDDAPVQIMGQPGWLLTHLGGDFAVLVFGTRDGHGDGALMEQWAQMAKTLKPAVRLILVAAAISPQIDMPGSIDVVHDAQGLVRSRYAGAPGWALLIRPDQHVAARFTKADAAALRAALNRTLCLIEESA